MISKAKQRLVKSLQSKKIRQKHQLFLVQGEKGVSETLDSDYQVDTVFVTDHFAQKYHKQLQGNQIVQVSEKELQDLGQASSAITPSKPTKEDLAALDEIPMDLDDGDGDM